MKQHNIDKTLKLLNKVAIPSSARSAYNLIGAKADADKTLITFQVKDEANEKLMFNISLERHYIMSELYISEFGQKTMNLWAMDELLIIAKSIKEQVDDLMWKHREEF